MTERLRADRIFESLSPIPPERKKKLLPDLVLKMVTGAKLIENYKNRKELVGVMWNNEDEVFNIEDIEIAKKIADSIWKEQIEEKNLLTTLSSMPTVLFLRNIIADKLDKIIDYKVKDKKKVIFIKDKTGCGYWRFVVPMRYVSDDKYFIDMSESEVIYDFLLEYDVILVQRLYTWTEYYTIDRLIRNGKKVIYDIDDDIYNIPPHNPASFFIRQDQVEAAKNIMKIVDKITTTTDLLKTSLGYPEKTIVIPNAIDLKEYPAKYNPPTDGTRRILWMGSATHHEDWYECIEAIDRIFKETNDVRLVVLGSLPHVVREYVEKYEHWDGKIEYSEFKDVETYVSITKGIRANVAIAPLKLNQFNKNKSAIKFVEYTACGFPTVCSCQSPYKEVITNGVSGFLASTQDEWYEYIKCLLDNENIGKKKVEEALKIVDKDFNVQKTSKIWEKIIFE